MKRRNFILLSAAGATAVGASYWYLHCDNRKYHSPVIEPESLSYIWDTETIGSIGSEYRKKRPEEDNELALLKLLGADTTDDTNAVAAIKKEITTDFKSGNTVMIYGWILSVTEVRQCALFSILKSN